MVKIFTENEGKMAKKLSVGKTFTYRRQKYTITLVGKGECKTDIYIKAKCSNCSEKEFKISHKKENAQFIENKIQRFSSLLTDLTKKVKAVLSRCFPGWGD